MKWFYLAGVLFPVEEQGIKHIWLVLWSVFLSVHSVFMAIEKHKGSGVFLEWKTLGIVKAIPLPMCVMVSKFKPGFKACFTVVAKDIFGRYGPYSKIIPAVIPDQNTHLP